MRNREQLLQALDSAALALHANAIRCRLIEEKVLQRTERLIDEVRTLPHPPPNDLLAALRLPAGAPEKDWRRAADRSVRDRLLKLLRAIRQCRQEERKTQPLLERKKAEILGISGIFIGPELAEAEQTVADIEEHSREMAKTVDAFKALAGSIGLPGADDDRCDPPMQD